MGGPYDETLELVAEIGAPAADSLRWQSMNLETEATTVHRPPEYTHEMARIQGRSALAEAFPTLDLYERFRHRHFDLISIFLILTAAGMVWQLLD